MSSASPKAIASATEPACANEPSPVTSSLSSSGWRDENSTGCPALTHSPPIVPPMCPDPITPMRTFALPSCAKADHVCNAVPSANAPPAASAARRDPSKGVCLRIGGLLSECLEFCRRTAPQARHGCVTCHVDPGRCPQAITAPRPESVEPTVLLQSQSSNKI